jgi:hypothetical protein
MSKHTQFSFPSYSASSQVEPKSRSRRLSEIGSLLRPKKLGAADFSSKKRALDADADGDVGGKGDEGNGPSSAQSARVKRTRLHSGVSITSISKLPVAITRPKPLEPQRASEEDHHPNRFRKRTSSSSSVETIRPAGTKEGKESRLRAPRVTRKPFHVGPAEPAKAVLTPTDVNIPKDVKRSHDDASLGKLCPVDNSEDDPGWLLSNPDGNASLSSKDKNYDFKCLKSVEDFTPLTVEDRNDPNPTAKVQECTQPDVSIKLFRQHVELWDTRPWYVLLSSLCSSLIFVCSDVYIYRAQVHLTSPLSGFDPCEPPHVDQLEISCTSDFLSLSQSYITYYTGQTTPGRKPQIDPSKGIHIGQRWWHSMPKEAGGSGAKGQWGWYLKMWIPIPLYVMRGREMGVFKVSTRVWMGNDKAAVDGNFGGGVKPSPEPEPIGAVKEFSLSCLRWTGKSFKEHHRSLEPHRSLGPPSGFVVPASLVTL